MYQQTNDGNLAVAQAIAAIQAQLQTLGNRMTQLKQPQAHPHQRRAAMRNVHQSEDALEGDEFGGAPSQQEIKPKPPDLTWSPTRNQSDSWVSVDFDYDTFDYKRFEFSGSRDPRDYLQWEQNMDEYFRYYSIPKKERLFYCLRQITGEAHQWWIQEEDDRWWYEEPTINTWGQLKWIMRERYAPNSLPQSQYPPDVSNHPHTSQKRLPQALDRKVTQLAPNEPNKEPTTYCPKSKEKTCCNVSFLVEKETTQCPKNDITHLILSREPKTGLGDAKEHITTRNIGVERQKKEEPNLNQKNTHGVIYSLLIKESPRDTQIKCKPDQNQGVLHSLLIKEAHPNSDNQILPKLIKPQGKLLKSFFHDTNLLSLHVGKTVLRTKLCQERGYDEVIKSKLNQSESELETNKEKDASKARIHGYQAWDPGESMWDDLRTSHTTFNQSKTISEEEVTLNGLLVYMDEDSRFEDMKTHSTSSIFPTDHKEFQHISFTNLDSSHFSQDKHQALAEKKPHLHSFSLDHGFIPLGFPGKVFNEASASQGDTLDGSQCFIAREHSK